MCSSHVEFLENVIGVALLGEVLNTAAETYHVIMPRLPRPFNAPVTPQTILRSNLPRDAMMGATIASGNLGIHHGYGCHVDDIIHIVSPL